VIYVLADPNKGFFDVPELEGHVTGLPGPCPILIGRPIKPQDGFYPVWRKQEAFWETGWVLSTDFNVVKGISHDDMKKLAIAKEETNVYDGPLPLATPSPGDSRKAVKKVPKCSLFVLDSDWKENDDEFHARIYVGPPDKIKEMIGWVESADLRLESIDAPPEN
jgi:hypothetical protein